METSPLEVLAKGVPETLLSIFCVFFYCKRKPEWTFVAVLWTILMVLTFFTRMWFDGFGISLLITLAIFVTTFYFIVKVPMSKAINGSLLVVLFVIVSEASNFLLIQVFFPDKLPLILEDASVRVLYMIPSTVILALLVFAVYYIQIHRNRKVTSKTDE